MKVDLQDIGCEGVGTVRMAQDRGRWRAFVFHKLRGISWPVE